MSPLDTSLKLESHPVDDEWSVNQALRQLEETRHRVSAENVHAADNRDLRPASPHLTLATNAASRLQGSMLAPEDREILVREGRRLGIREFDAHLVMAVVQDRARRGEGLEDLVGPLAMFTDSRGMWLTRQLRLIAGAIGFGMAIGTVILFIRWLTTGG